MKKLVIIIGMFLIGTCCLSVHAQTSKADKKAAKAADLKRMIESKRFIFTANQALPMGGSMVNLTSINYDLKLSNDTLTAFLPYFGVSYSAPLNPAEGGIKFTTTKFDYKVVQKKNGNYEVSFAPQNINPRTPADVTNMYLTVTASGYATLQVISLNRQGISFTGWLEDIKPKKL